MTKGFLTLIPMHFRPSSSPPSSPDEHISEDVPNGSASSLRLPHNPNAEQNQKMKLKSESEIKSL